MKAKYWLFVLFLTAAIGPCPLRADDTMPSISPGKAGYRMKLSSLGAVPSFPVGLSEARQVSVFGNRAFVLTQGAIAIIDISDPANPVHTGGFSPGIQAFVTFASDGKNIYGVTAPNYSTDSELEIWDVTDGAHPAKRSSLWLGEKLFWSTIRVAGRLVFVEPLYEEGKEIKIIDVSDPSRPREMAEYSASGDSISSWAVSGDKLLVTSGGSLEVIDISIPASPKLLGSLNLASKSWSIEVVGNTAFVGCYEADGFEGRGFLAVVDVSDPKLPVQTAEVPGNFGSLKVANGRLYAIAGDKIQIFDLSNLASPSGVAQITGYGFWSIDIAENKVYGGNFEDGLNIFDVSVPSAPKRVGGVPAHSPGIEGNYRAIALSGSYAYVFNDEGGPREQESGLLVFDVRDPSQPQLAARLPTPQSNYVSALEASGNVLCYGDQKSLSLVDITDPKSPKISAELGFTGSIAMAGNLLHVASDFVFRIIDVANPSLPTVRGKLPIADSSGLTDIKVSGKYAFLASADGALRIVDIGNPSAPRLETAYKPSEGTRLQAPLAVSGNYVFISSWHARDDGSPDYTAIDVLDVSDPAHPVLVAIQPIRSHGRRMRIAGNRLYIHWQESHMPGASNYLNVFDISNPKEIFQVAEFHTFSYSAYRFRDFAANEQFVFLAGSAFEVTRAEFQPFLGISQNGGRIELNWPNVDPAFQLQQASSFASPAEWISTSLAPATIEGQNYLSLPIESGANFFRLKKR